MQTIIEYSPYENKIKIKTIRKLWDHHGSYQWTYFNERVKQHIDFFLQKRPGGKNLDVGGGWYLSYPNSDIVDISPVCLDYNIAPPERKHEFDLDSIANGKKLPFPDRVFDSATFISSWQYLAHPWAVVEEAKRVSKPGAEIYIINGEGAGLSEAVNNQNRSEDIAKSFQERGYDTLTEDIPDSNGSIGGFRSVCVALPDSENGKSVSRIKGKKRRLKAALDFNPKKFASDFAEAEKAIMLEKLKKVEEYPITKYSRDLLNRIESFSKDYKRDTGNLPIFFSEEFSQLGFDMALEKQPLVSAAILYKDEDGYDNNLQEKGRTYGIRFGQNINYFGVETIEEFRQSLDGIAKNRHDANNDFSRETFRSSLMGFLGVQKLNSYAQDIGKEISAAIKSSGIKFGRELEIGEAFKLYLEASQHKQRRNIDELIERKNRIISEPELIAGFGKIDLNNFARYSKDFILGESE